MSLAPVYTSVLATVQGYTTFGILFYRVEFLRYLLLHLSSQLAAGDIETPGKGLGVKSCDSKAALYNGLQFAPREGLMGVGDIQLLLC